MPLYEYQCGNCGHTTEVLAMPNEVYETPNCDQCAGPDQCRVVMEPIMSPIAGYKMRGFNAMNGYSRGNVPAGTTKVGTNMTPGVR